MRFTFDTDNLVQRAKDVAARASLLSRYEATKEATPSWFARGVRSTADAALSATHVVRKHVSIKTVGTIVATAAATALALRI